MNKNIKIITESIMLQELFGIDANVNANANVKVTHHLDPKSIASSGGVVLGGVLAAMVGVGLAKSLFKRFGNVSSVKKLIDITAQTKCGNMPAERQTGCKIQVAQAVVAKLQQTVQSNMNMRNRDALIQQINGAQAYIEQLKRGGK